MNKKLDVSVVVLLLVTVIVATFLLTYMYMGGNLSPATAQGGGGEAKLAEALEIIEENFIGSYDEGKIVDGAISGMIEALDDRWSYYLTAEAVSYTHLDVYKRQCYVRANFSERHCSNEGSDRPRHRRYRF